MVYSIILRRQHKLLATEHASTLPLPAFIASCGATVLEKFLTRVYCFFAVFYRAHFENLLFFHSLDRFWTTALDFVSFPILFLMLNRAIVNFFTTWAPLCWDRFAVWIIAVLNRRRTLILTCVHDRCQRDPVRRGSQSVIAIGKYGLSSFLNWYWKRETGAHQDIVHAIC